MGAIGPFPGWLGASMIAVAIVWGVEQIDLNFAYLLAWAILLSVAVFRPGTLTAISDVLGSLGSLNAFTGANASGSVTNNPQATGAPAVIPWLPQWA